MADQDPQIAHDRPASQGDPALACFVLLVKFLGVPADAAQLAHERGRGDERWTLEDLTRSAKRLGLIAQIKTVPTTKLAALPLPALAEHKDGSAFILLKIEDEGEAPRALIQRSEALRPEVLTQPELAEGFAGRLMLITSREIMAGATRPFDISWLS